MTPYNVSEEKAIGRLAIADMIRALESNDERRNFRWESFTEEFVRQIRTARVFVDCGAEFGFYMRLALKYGPPDLRIIGFEPEQARCELLVESFAEAPNVEVYPYALADKQSTLTTTKPGQGASITFAPTVRNERFPVAQQAKLDVESVILDEFLRDVDVDVVKMDIEGAELYALRGMRRLLAKGKTTLFIEFHPQYIAQLEPGGYEGLRQMLSQAGYIADDARGRNTHGRAVLRPRAAPVAGQAPADVLIANLYASFDSSSDAVARRDLRLRLMTTINELEERSDLSAVEIHQIASLCQRVGDFAKARQWFERIDERWDGREAAGGKLFHLAEMLLAEGDKESASRQFHACVERIPNHRRAKEYLTGLS